MWKRKHEIHQAIQPCCQLPVRDIFFQRPQMLAWFNAIIDIDMVFLSRSRTTSSNADLARRVKIPSRSGSQSTVRLRNYWVDGHWTKRQNGTSANTVPEMTRRVRKAIISVSWTWLDHGITRCCSAQLIVTVVPTPSKFWDSCTFCRRTPTSRSRYFPQASIDRRSRWIGRYQWDNAEVAYPPRK